MDKRALLQAALSLCLLTLIAGEASFLRGRRLLDNITLVSAISDTKLFDTNLKVQLLLGQFGASCVQNSDCQSGSCSTFYKVCVESGCSGQCYSNPSNTFCWSGFCYPEMNNGGKCRVNSDCKSNKCYYGTCNCCSSPSTCTLPSTCPWGTYCGDVNWGSGYCYSTLPNGTPCSSSSQCMSNYCDSTQRCSVQTAPICPLCLPSYYCDKSTGYQCVYKKADGSYCSSAYQCKSGYCNSWLNQCTQPPGLVCYGEGTYCPPGQYCLSGFSGWTCALQVGNDQPCHHDWECQSKYCNSYLNVCTVAPGGWCSGPSGSCPRGQYCAWSSWSLSYQCTLLLSIGQTCSADTQCYSAYCKYSKCTTNIVPFINPIPLG